MGPFRSQSLESSQSTTTTSRSRGRHLLAAFGALLLAGSFTTLHPSTASAATVYVGQAAPVAVACNYRYHTMSLTAAASPAPGFASQTVWYQYFIFDLTTNSFVPGLSPTGFGTINAVSQVGNVTILGTTSSPTGTYTLKAGHRYNVRVDYWWLINGAWYGKTGIWTAGSQEFGYAWELGNGYATNDACYT